MKVKYQSELLRRAKIFIHALMLGDQLSPSSIDYLSKSIIVHILCGRTNRAHYVYPVF